MNWIAELYDLYEKNKSQAGRQMEEGTILLPLYHTTVAAQITVEIDGEGNFLGAETVPEEDKLTLIPVTEESASRTANPTPHPLCDNLEYLAGDYESYATGKKCGEKHALYMEKLERWVHSPFSHPKAEAVYRYLLNNTLMGDLLACGVLQAEEDGRITEKRKLQIVPQTKAFVRFRIEDGRMMDRTILTDESGTYTDKCWKDGTLQKSYIDYCAAGQEQAGLSYLTGRRMPVSYLQPKKIRNEGDGAKLISSNDSENFTYKGRFATKEEAFAIGYEDSQKVHNALKWILRKQGGNYDSLYFVTWESDLHDMPGWQDGSDRILEKGKDRNRIEGQAGVEERSDRGDESDFDEEIDLDDEVDVDEEGVPQTGAAQAARLRRAIRGYGKFLSPSSRTVIMAFDAATTGRLAIMEYKDYASSRYLQALEKWQERCFWRHQKVGKQKGRYTYYGMVGVKDAAELLYGTEEKGKGYFSMKGKEERYKYVAQRWMPCILEGRAVPEDMVNLAVRRASSPVSFDSRFLWERILTLACSLVKQQYEKRFKEVWTMALDETCTKRDYLYGRLLAVADRIEYRTYSKEYAKGKKADEDKKDKESGRETNAKRYMSAFSQHPFRTWKIIEEKLEPYLARLDAGERIAYQNLADEVYEKFTMEDYENDAPLSGLYLLGFHNQAFALQRGKKKETEEEE